MNHRILFYAFRYALGRMTTAPSEVVREIIYNWNALPEGYQVLIKEEIEHAIKTKQAGMPCDVDQWLQVLAL